MARSVLGSTSECHICGLPIPEEIVSADHPLYGTVDHVIPRSRGGKDTIENKRAAHRVCNIVKGSREVQFVDVNGLHGMVKSCFQRLGLKVTRQMMSRARHKIGLPPSKHGGGARGESLPRPIQVWDWEGGFVGNRTEHYDE